MGAKRTEYQIVGRYMDGKEVTAYHLQSLESGKAGRYTREQVCYLVGRDQITNCTGQIYGDKVILRGKGMSLEDLPIQQENGSLSRTTLVGKVKKGTSADDAMTQLRIVGTLKSGRNTVGYIVQNAGCATKKLKREQVIELAKQGKIGNARVQNYNGSVLLRGVDCNLDELPIENIDSSIETEVQEDKTLKIAKKLMHNINARVKTTNNKINQSELGNTVYNILFNVADKVNNNYSVFIILDNKGNNNIVLTISVLDVNNDIIEKRTTSQFTDIMQVVSNIASR